MSKAPSKPATCKPQQQAPTKPQNKPAKGKVKAAEATFAGQLEKRAAVAGAFTAARQFYESGDGAINLLDPLHCTGVQQVLVRCSSIAQEATEKRAKLCQKRKDKKRKKATAKAADADGEEAAPSGDRDEGAPAELDAAIGETVKASTGLLVPENCIVCPSADDQSCFHDKADWRADRRNTVLMADPVVW